MKQDGIVNYYEFGLVKSTDSDDFAVKLESLSSRWKSLCPGFFHWFGIFHCKRGKLFIDSVIKLSRLGVSLKGLYHRKQYSPYVFRWKKRIEFHERKHHYNTAQSTKNHPKRIRLWNTWYYRSGNNVLSPTYKKFQVTSHKWHSWYEERKVHDNKKFREYNPTISETFTMLANSVRKPGFQHRKRNNAELDIATERFELVVPSENQSFDETIGCIQNSTEIFFKWSPEAREDYELHLRSKVLK